MEIMVLLGFMGASVIVGLILYLPFFLWFRLRRPRASHGISLDLQVSLHLAFVSARRLRYKTLSLEQLLLALLDNPSAADVLRVCALDIEAMRACISAIVRGSSLVAGGTEAIEPEPSPEFLRVLQRAIARDKAVEGADLLAALLEESDGIAVKELRRRGVTHRAVMSAIVRGIPSADFVASTPRQASDTAELAIVLENDDSTPMEFVVEVLQQHLGLSLESAVRVMLQIHHEGRAVAARSPADVAADKVEYLRATARQAGYPLQCTVKAM